MSGTGSGTSSLRETKPDPMTAADRDGQPYLKETEYRVQSAESSAESSVVVAASIKPLTAKP